MIMRRCRHAACLPIFRRLRRYHTRYACLLRYFRFSLQSYAMLPPLLIAIICRRYASAATLYADAMLSRRRFSTLSMVTLSFYGRYVTCQRSRQRLL